MPDSRDSRRVICRVETVTPETAERWLRELNIDNRPKTKGHIQYLASEITGGRWCLTGEPIVFTAGRARLLDGQHRLAAIVLAGVAVELLIVEGVDEAAFIAMGRGKARSAQDALAMAQLPNAHILAGASRLLLEYRSNDLRNMHRIAPALILEIAQKESGLQAAVSDVRGKLAAVPLPPSLSALAIFVLREANPDADEFLGGLATGASLDPGSPLLALRNKLLSLQTRTTSPHARGNGIVRTKITVGHREVFAAVIRAFNEWVRGETSIFIKLTNPEKLPKPLRDRRGSCGERVA